MTSKGGLTKDLKIKTPFRFHPRPLHLLQRESCYEDVVMSLLQVDFETIKETYSMEIRVIRTHHRRGDRGDKSIFQLIT
jgi:hypothetical protein